MKKRRIGLPISAHVIVLSNSQTIMFDTELVSRIVSGFKASDRPINGLTAEHLGN